MKLRRYLANEWENAVTTLHSEMIRRLEEALIMVRQRMLEHFAKKHKESAEGTGG